MLRTPDGRPCCSCCAATVCIVWALVHLCRVGLFGTPLRHIAFLGNPKLPHTYACHPPEQGPSWSTLDFGGAPKLSHHFLRRAYEPLMLWGHLDRDTGRVTVHLTSDLMHPIAGVWLLCSATGLTVSRDLLLGILRPRVVSTGSG